MAGAIPSRSSSRRFRTQRKLPAAPEDTPLHKSHSDRLAAWKSKKSTTAFDLRSTASDLNFKTWDGHSRTAVAWDGLRRDSELWFPDGNCLVHLYARGQSRRGPAFQVPMDALLATNCRRLLDRFLFQSSTDSPISESSNSSADNNYFSASPRKYELYIPAPSTTDRGQAFFCHVATRNLFAWILGKPLVGSHLGGAMVGLLNSMNEFRSTGEDNVQAIMDYMDSERYADIRNSPDHALAILFFAEHFQFKDMWIDAFAHCVGMHEKLASSPDFECISRTSRALITRSRMEMNLRLEYAGRQLGTFLSDDLSDAHLGLSSAARDHLDKFRTFLQSYYVAKLGYYPPVPSTGTRSTFPKSTYAQMCAEFQKLYDFLVDKSFTSSMTTPPRSQQGGVCIVQSLQAFDTRHKYTPLPYPLPLLPEGEEVLPKSRRASWYSKGDKMRPDPRLITLSSMMKATNRLEDLECSLVRAYRGFEKECILPNSRLEKHEKLSPTDARKVRWILVYTVLQTLLSVTKVPVEVRDTVNVSYNLCILTAGTPPWKGSRPIETLIRKHTDQTKEDFITSLTKAAETELAASPSEIVPDIDYFALAHRPQSTRQNSISLTGQAKRKGTVRRALSTLGNMPELRHPSPKRLIYHEILVHGYGNGTNSVSLAPSRTASVDNLAKKPFVDEDEEISSRWSVSSVDALDILEASRISYNSSRVSNSIKEFLDSPSSAVSQGVAYETGLFEDSNLQPHPLRLSRSVGLVVERKEQAKAALPQHVIDA
ncbi:hypothetical protein B0O99DRAFT_686614 [Bisporella sp. PMI_857]|nr:hypothetical protein B0O99DRAFT_686614 [Bisporella sp. PMI_857]